MPARHLCLKNALIGQILQDMALILWSSSASIGCDRLFVATLWRRSPIPGSLAFGPFEVNVPAGQLLKSGVRIRLSGQPFQILLILLAHPGDVVANEQLREQIWKDGTFVISSTASMLPSISFGGVWEIQPRIRATSKPCPAADTDS